MKPNPSPRHRPPPDPAPSPPLGGRRDGLWVAALGTVIYLGSLGNQPTLDDGWVVFDSPMVRTFDLVRMFTQPYNSAGPATTGGLFRPVTTLTYALNYALGGRAGAGFHAVNVLLHGLVTWLVWLLARRLLGAVAPARARAGALAAALLFAVHPVHVEAVAALTGRAELLAAAGALGALLLAGRPGLLGPLLAAPVLALGVLSKEIASTAPALHAGLALLAPAAVGLRARPGLATPAARAALRRAAGVCGALLAAVAVYFAIRPGAGLGVPPEARWFGTQPRAIVLGTMARAGVEYLRLLVWPHPLGIDFFYAARIPNTPIGAPAALAAVAALATLALGAVLVRRREPLLAIGVGWVLVGLLPVSNVLLPTGVLMAERLLYLPSVGFCLWAGDLAARAGALARARAGVPGARAALAAGAAILVALAGKSVARGLDWRDSLHLYEAEVQGAPLDPVVNNNLAVEYNARGRYQDAKARLAVVIRTTPGYWRAWVNLGIAQQRTGDTAGALRSFDRARLIDPGAPSPLFFAALALADLGRVEEAVEQLRAAAARAPEDARTRLYLGRYLARLGRRAEARAELLRAAALDPKDPTARAELARLAE